MRYQSPKSKVISGLLSLFPTERKGHGRPFRKTWSGYLPSRLWFSSSMTMTQAGRQQKPALRSSSLGLVSSRRSLGIKTRMKLLSLVNRKRSSRPSGKPRPGDRTVSSAARTFSKPLPGKRRAIRPATPGQRFRRRQRGSALVRSLLSLRVPALANRRWSGSLHIAYWNRAKPSA